MTILSAVPGAVVRPVPWRRLTWVAWRRYRTALVATAAVLAVTAVYLVITGERMRSAYATYLAVHTGPLRGVPVRLGELPRRLQPARSARRRAAAPARDHRGVRRRPRPGA